MIKVILHMINVKLNEYYFLDKRQKINAYQLVFFTVAHCKNKNGVRFFTVTLCTSRIQAFIVDEAH